MSPPAAKLPLPTDKLMSPPLPVVAVPVPRIIEPLEPELVVPELKLNTPLTPDSPALDVLIAIAPLDVAVPTPAVIHTPPPVSVVL